MKWFVEELSVAEILIPLPIPQEVECFYFGTVESTAMLKYVDISIYGCKEM